jgi:alpha-1,2-mannosyltransferase
LADRFRRKDADGMNLIHLPSLPSLAHRVRSHLRSPAVCWGLFTFVLVAASIPYAVKASEQASAFVRWHNQIQNLIADADIYLEHNYPNPPMMALLLYPLTLLPPVIGALCWYFLKVGMGLLAIAWSFRLVQDRDGAAYAIWPLGAVLALALRPFLGDLSHGNVNLFILFLVMAALHGYRRNRDFSAGLLLALAVACKVTPALFLPYFLWKRAWKLLAGSLIGLLLFVFIVPGICLGTARNTQLLHSWTEQMVRPFVASGQVLYTEHNNQSLPATVMRLTTASPSFSEWDGERRAPVSYHNVLDLAPMTASWLVKGSFVLFGVLMIGTCRTRRDTPERWRLPAEFSLVMLGMLLFSERTWKHHCVLLLLPYTVLVQCLAGGKLEKNRRTAILGLVVLSVVLIASTSTGLLPAAAAKLAQVYGAYVWAHLLLVAALAVMLFDAAPAASGAPTAADGQSKEPAQPAMC